MRYVQIVSRQKIVIPNQSVKTATHFYIIRSLRKSYEYAISSFLEEIPRGIVIVQKQVAKLRGYA